MTNPHAISPASSQHAAQQAQSVTPAGLDLRWPAAYLPQSAPVFVHNEILVAAPVATVWAWLLRAELWPTWYPNAADIHFLSHAAPDLRDRSRFRWKTFGLRFTSKVLDFEPGRRLAWDAHGVGVDAFHIWLLTPQPDGTTPVLTEEVQHGWLARIANRLDPARIHAQHQLWLEALAHQAQAGPPPA